MNTAREIESAIERLPAEEQELLAAWFEQRFQNRWDNQMVEDAASGKLDRLYDRAKSETGSAESIPLDDFLDNQKLS